MSIAINELSFIGQSPDIYNAINPLRELMNVIASLKVILDLNEVVTSSNLCNTLLCPGIDLHTWIHMRDNETRDLRDLLIATIKSGPFIDLRMQSDQIKCSCTCDSTDVSYTSVAGVAHYRGVLVSLAGAGGMSSNPINVDVCHSSCSTLQVQNFCTLAQVATIDRVYVPIDKHENHGWGTPMDLNFEDAQATLRSGIVVGDRVYGKFANKYYNFMSDNAGGFHGYPISDYDVPNRAKQFLKNL